MCTHPHLTASPPNHIQYSNWDAIDPVELFQAPTRKEPTSKFITHHLAAEGKGADVLVLWLDCDREGENICFEVIDCMKPGFKTHTRILRARFSAITPKDIQAAMQTLGEPNKNEALAVDARYVCFACVGGGGGG